MRRAFLNREQDMAAVLAGFPLGGLPTFLCEEEVRRGELVRVLPAYALEDKPLWLVYPSARHLSRPVAALRDALLAGLGAR